MGVELNANQPAECDTQAVLCMSCDVLACSYILDSEINKYSKNSKLLFEECFQKKREKESHWIQKVQRFINFLKVSFSLFFPHFFCLCVWKVPKIQPGTPWISVLKILFDIREALETVAIQIWRTFQNMRRWTGKAFEKGLNAIGLDMYSLTYPNCRHLSRASMPSSIMVHCALTRTVDPGFVIPVYDTVHWSRLRKPAWLLKEWMGDCSATKQRAVYPSC